MKLEVGQFVRTKNGIKQIYEIDNNKTKWKYLYKLKHQDEDGTIDLGMLCDDDIIREPSFDIIDLIENKDLCEIEFYSLRYNERVTRLFEVEIITDTYINFKNARCEFLLINKQWNSEDLELNPIIKTILTKEQFENNCYKIGD